MKLKELKPLLEYDQKSGTISVLGKRKRILCADEDGMICTTVNGIKCKMKYNKLAWYLIYDKLPRVNQIVFHRNLDENDFSMQNLMLLSKTEYNTLQESLKNLQGGLRMYNHPSDVFSYVIEYRLSGRLRKEVISDATVAKSKFSKLQFKFIKFISRYVLTT